MIRRLLSIALAGVLAACASSDPRLPPPSTTPPVFDHLIVPGTRVGPVSIGMTKDQLFAAMGLPVDTIVSYTDVFVHLYQVTNIQGLRVAVGKSSSRVWYIEVGNENYRTSQGLAVGMQERQVRELMGPPEKVVLKTAHSQDMYCYPGLRVYFGEGKVGLISVNPWGCSKL